MVLGHYAVALASKRAAPGLSLGTAILAAQLIDGLWPIFLLLGLEEVRIVPGLMAANPLDFVHYPITHSLLAVVGWALLVASGYYAVRRWGRGALVVGILVVSHWFLDAPMHRPDLPLWPGSAVLVGGGLWNSVSVTLAIEFSLLVLGLAVYVRATRPRDGVGRWGLWSMVAVLGLVLVGGIAGPPPESERALAITALGLWLFVPWGYWIDAHRVVRSPLGPALDGSPVSAPSRPLNGEGLAVASTREERTAPYRSDDE